MTVLVKNVEPDDRNSFRKASATKYARMETTKPVDTKGPPIIDLKISTSKRTKEPEIHPAYRVTTKIAIILKSKWVLPSVSMG